MSPTVAQAVASMSPQSRADIDNHLLSVQAGRRTIAGSLNQQINFRFDRRGESVDDWDVIPDTRLAAELLATPAADGIRRIARTIAGGASGMEPNARLEGFRLLPDLDAIRSTVVLDSAHNPKYEPYLRSTGSATGFTTKLAQGMSRNAGAWYSLDSGWIGINPVESRALLTSIGAYTPKPEELSIRQAKMYARYLPESLDHEAQHGISPTTNEGYAAHQWIEEGTARLLSSTPQAREQSAELMGISRHSYAGHLGAPDHFDPGWGAWNRPPQPSRRAARVEDARVKRTYADSEGTLTSLLRLAGAHPLSDDGLTTARSLLQGGPVEETANRLSAAIADRFGLSSGRQGALTRRIRSANESGAIEAIMRDFGLTASPPDPA